MDFGQAIEAAKSGKRILRDGWEGPRWVGKWAAYTPPSTLPADLAALSRAARLFTIFEGHETVTVAGHLDLRDSDGTIVVNWSPPVVDLLAKDWLVVDDPVEMLQVTHDWSVLP